MNNTPFLSTQFGRFHNLAKLFDDNLNESDFIIFYKDSDIKSFSFSVRDFNFCHLVGLNIKNEFRSELRRQGNTTSPLVLAYQSILVNDKDIMRWLKSNHSKERILNKLDSAEVIFNFPYRNRIQFGEDSNHLGLIINSDHFIFRNSNILGFAQDEDTGKYYLETNLHKDIKYLIPKSHDVLAVVRSRSFLNYELTMLRENRLNNKDKNDILNEFVKVECFSNEALSIVKFIENDIYRDNFKDLWEEIVEQNCNLETSHNRYIDFERVSLDDEITYAKSISSGLNIIEVKSNKDIGSFEPDIWQL